MMWLKRHIGMLVVLTFVLSPQLQAQDERVSYIPSVDYKAFLIKQALESSEKRDRVINILDELLKIYPEGEEKAQLRIRMAQLYLDKARHLYFVQLYKNDPEAEKLIRGELAFQKQDEAKLDLNNSFSYNRRAIKIYRGVLEQYPKIYNRDEIQFFLAYNLGEIGETKEALRLYRDLIKRFPKSPYVPEAYLVQGETFFYSNNMARAMQYYRKVLKYRGSEVYDLALYKIAWCHFNLGRISLAMKTMERLIAISGGSPAGIDLKQEGIRDIVVMFSFGGYYKEAPFYFKQVGGEENYRKMIKQLANLYYNQGKNTYAQATYRRVIKEDPSDKENPNFQKRLVEIARRLGRKQDIITEANKLVKFYSDESQWTEKNRNDWNALQQARELSEKTLRSVALSLHNEAQKTKDDQTYKLAMASYREYLDNFPETPIANKIRFYYGESLYKLGNKEQAAQQYQKVVATNPKEPFALQAAYGAIVSYDELIKDLPAPETGKNNDPIFIPLWQRELVRSADAFTANFPTNDRAPQITFKAAKVFYDYNHFKEAVRRFDSVVSTYPKSPAAKIAANLVLDSFNIQEKWAQVVKWGKKYYRNPNLPEGQYKRDLYGVIEKASFKVSRSLEQSGQYLLAAKNYMEFANEFKGSQFVDDALNNAAISYRKGKDIEASINTFRRLVKEHPKSKFVRSATHSIGKGYEDLARFDYAAYYYELYQSRYPKSKDAPDLIYNAGVFRENLGQIEKAIKDYKIYVANYSSKKDAAQTEFAMALIYEREKRWAEAAVEYQRLATKYTRQLDFYFVALSKWGVALKKQGKTKSALSVFRRVVKEYQPFRKRQLALETIDAVAEAQFEIVESVRRSYARIGLNVPLAQFEGNIRRKTRYLDRLIKEYQQIIDYATPRFVVKSIHGLARAYDNFAIELKKVKAPAQMDAASKAQFEQQIGGFATNMRNKSIEAYTACLERAAEFGVFDAVVAKAEKRRLDLTAQQKTQVEEVIIKPTYVEDAIGRGKV